jgi:NAD-dependent SIR2 family protein deacetylase
MAPVTFPHSKHQEQIEKYKDKYFKDGCNICHHKRQGDAAPAKCSTCHGKVKEAPTFKKAMHNKCKKCHKAMKKDKVKAGPTKCNGCHVKK